MNSQSRPPFPPFSYEDAITKVRKAENAWNGKNAEAVALAYTENSAWRNRNQFITGRQQIIEFLTLKWQTELDYKLVKEIWAHSDNRIAVRFAYEWHDRDGNWFRSYGNENWQFDSAGLMEFRHASINDLAIEEQHRKFTWQGDIRPEDFPESCC